MIHTALHVACDRCGRYLRDDHPGCMMSFADLFAVEATLRQEGWIGPNESFMANGEQDAMQVCKPCQDLVAAEIAEEAEKRA